MEKFDKKKAEEEVIRTMTISKYTSLRYMSTIAFFICLYMIIGSVLVGDYKSILLFIIIDISQVLINNEIIGAIRFKNDGKLSKTFYLISVSLLISGLILILTLIDFKLIFPYLASKNFAIILSGLLFAILSIAVIKVCKIRNENDKISKKIKEYKSKRGLYV